MKGKKEKKKNQKPDYSIQQGYHSDLKENLKDLQTIQN